MSDERVQASASTLSIQSVLVKSFRTETVISYTGLMPKLWNETIAAHRRAVREAILDTTAALVAGHGLRSVTMSQIAEQTGIGRATLYKYFPDVDAILLAWHERQIAAHLDQLAVLRDQAGSAVERLQAMLATYAHIASTSQGHQDTELAISLHRGAHVAHAHHQLHAMVRDVLTEGAASGDLRDDVPADELASYCLHAIAAARSMSSQEAVHRLVMVTLAGLRPQR